MVRLSRPSARQKLDWECEMKHLSKDFIMRPINRDVKAKVNYKTLGEEIWDILVPAVWNPVERALGLIYSVPWEVLDNGEWTNFVK